MIVIKIFGVFLLISVVFIGFLELTCDGLPSLARMRCRSRVKKRIAQYKKDNSFKVKSMALIQEELATLPITKVNQKDVLARLSEFENIEFLGSERNVIEPKSDRLKRELRTIRFTVDGRAIEYDFQIHTATCYFYYDEKIAIIDVPKYFFKGATMILVIENNRLLPVYYSWQECTLQELEDELIRQPDLKINDCFDLITFREGNWISYIQNDVRIILQEKTYPSFDPIGIEDN